jgi:ferredoxin--NADP+ reductase
VDGRVGTVVVERNRLVRTQSGYIQSEGTGSTTRLDAGLILRSVGYRAVPLPGVPFDESRHVVPNEGGRVTDGPGGRVLPGEFVSGWIKRGPSGIIGTNKPDAVETVAAMLEEGVSGGGREREVPDPAAIPALLESRRIRFVTFPDWKKLDEAERAAGAEQGRPRVKIVHRERMLDIMGR